MYSVLYITIALTIFLLVKVIHIKDDDKHKYKQSEVDNQYIFKVYNTITNETTYEVIIKDIIDLYYYSAYDYFKRAKFIGKHCYYENNFLFYLFKIMLYKDDNYELLYDLRNEKIILYPSNNHLDNLIYSNAENNLEINDISRML